MDSERPLPDPTDPSVNDLFSSQEAAEACRFLLMRLDSPPTTAEWLARSQQVFGKSNVQSQRRLREVRSHFVVQSRRRTGDGKWIYQLLGWKKAASAAVKISARLQAEAFGKKGRFCQMCGRGPQDGIRLQIDHIAPESWGGKTVYSNLEPLCEEHNHGKQAFFASLDAFGPAIGRALPRPTPWERIGELLISFQEMGKSTPVELIELVAQDTHKGDPKKRLRELRFILGWDIVAHRRKTDGVTEVTYERRRKERKTAEHAATKSD
ncbi:HNH endonuclease signature motif containing protein [Kitasatospora sp. SUK 42]|uniref:HNH endonuclease n=1 Tax=Kitasatospora sp. SUK 42 TaxID=1588882 RepID=UPI0027E32DD7|nr:HNH endonuclease signature motif containing protein [Kitasatospora sp. SUK 42]